MIYLDNSATTAAFSETAQVVQKYMTETFYNPSSSYLPAVEAERAVNDARKRIAQFFDASGEEIVFTSGGTESNNMAINGVAAATRRVNRPRIITTAGEHASVFETCRRYESLGYEVVYLGIRNGGAIDPNELRSLMTPSTLIVSMMHVNNETGAVNDVDAAYKIMRAASPSALMHVDGAQSFLKLSGVPRCDMYTLCAHKFHGPKGVGALYVRKGIRFSGGQIGGGQEGGLRSGTLNVPGIMGMDSAIAKYMASQQRYIERMRACKLRLAGALLEIGDTIVNGPQPDEGAPNILNVSFLGVRGEVLLHALEERRVYVSTGSACSAKKQGKNRILTAMGITGERAEGAIRFSFSPFNTPGEMDEAAAHVRECVNTLRKFKRK